jgi:mannose-6-phosphate isomerase-like protein (cupin superfamily)
MDHLNYYQGNIDNDRERELQNRKQWLVGRFLDGHRSTEAFALKYWKFKKGEPINHPTKYEELATECDIILEGSVKGHIDGEEVILRKGDYVVIPPKVTSNLIEELLTDEVVGITIKAPSLPPEDSVKLS